VTVPTDDELVEVLTPFVGAVRGIDRRPYPYATSFPLEEVRLDLVGGDSLHVIFKDLRWDRLLPDAAMTKPAFLDDPTRTIETHRCLLEPLGIRPRLVASVCDEAHRRHWLFTTKVDGVELWQVGDIRVWEATARWLARFHGQFLGRSDEARARCPSLLEYGPSWYRRWEERARSVLRTSDDERAPALLGALERVGDGFDDSLTTFVHGEFYPSNVLVAGGEDVRVEPVDWEMAGTGSPFLDLAALASGWDPERRSDILRAYAAAAPFECSLDLLTAGVDRSRLHLALRWLSWSADWQPPAEHARDWIAEALDAVGRLG
jgi:hypothetical protein